MPEPDNDRLEHFFRKAASKPDVTFNEEDWKKLEARLDAAASDFVAAKKTGSKITSAVVVGIVLLFSSLLWVDSRYDIVFSDDKNSPEHVDAKVAATYGEPETRQDAGLIQGNDVNGVNKNNDAEKISESDFSGSEKTTPSAQNKISDLTKRAEISKAGDRISDPVQKRRIESVQRVGVEDQSVAADGGLAGKSKEKEAGESLVSTDIEEVFTGPEKENISDERIQISPAVAEKIKQKAVVELPGAEEEQTREAEAIVSEEHASDHKKHVATPRLSLLLSFAPDFSSTRISEYSAPGKAFGAMIHYHVMNRWSISAGVIKNFKKYSSAGEDYNPPKGYWKYYTNGIIPNSIDGSCSILEFPVMVQYTIYNSGKNKWLAGAGASSYLMLSESYKYYFEDPNPGAKERWDSKHTSRFLFNMINLTVGYERQVVPGLMLGLEPYVKIPMKEIGWSNIKLFSTGASITLRYKILGRQNVSIPSRSRGPD